MIRIFFNLELFLLGLEKYGKGDWRSISRNFVVTRTPTQVASHAQKYFIRLNSMNKDRRRSSIHDITSVNNGDVSASQAPITGQTNGSAGNSTGKSGKQAPPASTGVPSVGIYAAPTIGQPIGGPLVSAVGTPVNLPAPGHMAYGVRAPVPGAPMNIVPMTYPMSQTSAPHSVNNGDVSASQAPITGQTNGSAGNSTGKSGKQAPPASTGVPSVGIYAAPTIGQPIGGPLVSAVGTPVNLPAPGHMAYGVRAPVPGAPMNIVPMTYPMSQTSAPHR
ncbi:hypothetical protein TanjilG_15233 [Lupinus angustifolius]|uniref:Uncharacterized protein n=1 Tax=Lupinus angustifolius TaxID=3871 RepID=A0A1J7GNA1_LUPAN|nr:hypothetical protein TanjilG_15233 [Lupinus angustifolius]